MTPLFLAVALKRPASAAISFSFTRVKGAGTRRSLRGGEQVATVEAREWVVGVGEVERVEVYDVVEKRVTVAVPLLSWLSCRVCRVREPDVEGREVEVGRAG